MEATKLASAITSLAEIRRDGKLSELLQGHANECRERQLPSHRDFWDPGRGLEVTELTRAAQQLFGIGFHEAEAVVKSVVINHPRTEVAMEWIEHYRPVKAVRRSRCSTPEEDAEWNATTGGPVVEQWEEEQRQIELSRANRQSEPKRLERKW